MRGCVNLCLGMFVWEVVWHCFGTSMAPTYSTPRLVAVNWKDQAQKSYYFGREDLVERSQDSWASVVHKDLAWMAVLGQPGFDSIEPTSPFPLGLLSEMEDTAEVQAHSTPGQRMRFVGADNLP